MFKVEEFKIFVEDKVNNKFINNYDLLIKAIYQQNVSIPKFTKLSSRELSRFYKKIFNDEVYINKPKRLALNKWLLFLFGYKKCRLSNKILPLSDFYVNNKNWDKLTHESKKGLNDYRKYNRPIMLKYERNYISKNPEKFRAKWAKKQACKNNRTPKWLTNQDYIEINDIYWCAKEHERLLGETFHVDHIIPLRGKNVCGLHVPWNLQVLSAKENLEKGNKF